MSEFQTYESGKQERFDVMMGGFFFGFVFGGLTVLAVLAMVVK